MTGAIAIYRLMYFRPEEMNCCIGLLLSRKIILPDEDIETLKQAGIEAIFTPGTPAETIIDAFRLACSGHHSQRS